MVVAKQRRWLVLLLTGMLVLTGCSSFDSDDEQEPAELTDFDAEVDLDSVWSQNIGDGQGGLYNRLTPAIGNGMIVAAAYNGDVEAFDLLEGDSLWDVDLDRNLIGGVGIGGGRVFVAASDGSVVALSAATGEELWSSPQSGEVLAPPQTDGERVYLQTFDGYVVALDAENGKKLWSFASSVPVLTLRGTSTPLLHQGQVIAGLANGKLVSLDAETGKLRWEQRVSSPQGSTEIERLVDIDGELLIHNDVLYAVSYQGRIAAIDPNTGRRLWSREASSYVGMSEGFSNVYVAGHSGNVIAFAANGQGVRWEQTVLARRRLTAPITWQSYVAVGDFEGYLHLLSQVDGHLVGRTRVDSDGLRARPIVVGDLLYVYANNGDLVAYRLEQDD